MFRIDLAAFDIESSLPADLSIPQYRANRQAPPRRTAHGGFDSRTAHRKPTTNRRYAVPDYAALTRETRAFKSALTRAKNREDHAAVVEVCARALSRFDIIGYPDCWAMFDAAARDARFAMQRAEW